MANFPRNGFAVSAGRFGTEVRNDTHSLLSPVSGQNLPLQLEVSSEAQEEEEEMKELHLLAIYVHGALSALHALGVAYNLRHKNRWDAVIHASALAYSVKAVFHHKRKAQ